MYRNRFSLYNILIYFDVTYNATKNSSHSRKFCIPLRNEKYCEERNTRGRLHFRNNVSTEVCMQLHAELMGVAFKFRILFDTKTSLSTQEIKQTKSFR